MGHDGKPLTRQRRKRKDTTHRSQFLAAVTTHDACFTEQGFYGRVAGGDGSRMARCRPAATLARTSFDSGYATTLSDEARCVEEQFVGIGDVFNIEQLHGGVGFWIEVLVHILQHVLDANLFSVAY